MRRAGRLWPPITQHLAALATSFAAAKTPRGAHAQLQKTEEMQRTWLTDSATSTPQFLSVSPLSPALHTIIGVLLLSAAAQGAAAGWLPHRLEPGSVLSATHAALRNITGVQ